MGTNRFIISLISSILMSCAYSARYPENEFSNVSKFDFKSVRLLDSTNKEIIKGSCLYIDNDTLKVCSAFGWKGIPKEKVNSIEVKGNRAVDATLIILEVSIGVIAIISGTLIILALSAT